jgi:hypothetical protein
MGLSEASNDMKTRGLSLGLFCACFFCIEVIRGSPITPLHQQTISRTATSRVVALPLSGIFPLSNLIASPTAVLNVSDILNDGRIPIGTGVNSVTGAMASTAVDVTGMQMNSVGETQGLTAGNKLVYTFKQVDSLDQVKQQFGMSLSESVGLGFFSESAGYSFFQQSAYNSYSNYVFIHAEVKNPERVLDPPPLLPSAKQFVSQGAVKFGEQYGDEFVYGVQSGGSFTAIISVQSSSSEDQNKASAQLQLSLPIGVGGDAEFSQAIQALKSFNRIQIYIERNGGLSAVPSLDELQKGALNFEQEVVENPVIYALLTTSYLHVKDAAVPFAVAQSTEILNEEVDFAQIASWIESGYELRGNIAYIRDHLDEFQIGPNTDLDGMGHKVESEITRLGIEANKCAANPGNYTLPSAPDYPNVAAIHAAPAPPAPPPPTSAPKPTGRTFGLNVSVAPNFVNAPPPQGLDQTSLPCVIYRVPESLQGADVTITSINVHNYGIYALQLGAANYITNGDQSVFLCTGSQQSQNVKVHLLPGEEIIARVLANPPVTVSFTGSIQEQ